MRRRPEVERAVADDLAQFLGGAAYEGVEFPVIELHTSWGHDSVKHRALGRPGSDTATTGLRERTVQVKALFTNDLTNWPDTLFPARLRQLLDKLRTTPKGVFDHPFHGQLNMHVDDVGEPIDINVRNGVTLAFTLSEYDDAAAEIADPNDRRPSDPASEMVAAATATDAAVADAIPTESARPPAVTGVVLGQLAFLEGGMNPSASSTGTTSAASGSSTTVVTSAVSTSGVRPGGVARGYVEATAAFAEVQRSVTAVLTNPALQGIAGHDARVAAEATRVATLRYQARYLGDSQPSSYFVPATMSLGHVAALIYGDPRKTPLLRGSNQIPDELFIPAGTVLRVPALA
jgi:prophage DNA circulation protein